MEVQNVFHLVAGGDTTKYNNELRVAVSHGLPYQSNPCLKELRKTKDFIGKQVPLARIEPNISQILVRIGTNWSPFAN
jgi:hypothetical protein